MLQVNIKDVKKVLNGRFRYKEGWLVSSKKSVRIYLKGATEWFCEESKTETDNNEQVIIPLTTALLDFIKSNELPDLVDIKFNKDRGWISVNGELFGFGDSGSYPEIISQDVKDNSKLWCKVNCASLSEVVRRVSLKNVKSSYMNASDNILFDVKKNIAEVYTTDGLRLMKTEMELLDCSDSFKFVVNKNIGKITDIFGEVKISSLPLYVKVSDNGSSCFYYESVSVYPDVISFIERESEKDYGFGCVFKRDVLNSHIKELSKSVVLLNFSVSDNACEVWADGLKEKVRLDTESCFGSVSLKVNIEYFSDCVNCIRGDKIIVAGVKNNTPIWFMSEDFRDFSVLMPFMKYED